MALIWANQVDKKYDCRVDSDEGDTHLGKLKISLNGEVLHTESVTISYGAPFGPDAADVHRWCDICISFVDRYEADLKKQ